jgi:hypothetical protein
MARGMPLAKKHKFSGGHPASKAKLGSGGRFKALERKLAHEKGIRNPGALAAAIGRKKYGKKRYGKLSGAGRRHHH